MRNKKAIKVYSDNYLAFFNVVFTHQMYFITSSSLTLLSPTLVKKNFIGAKLLVVACGRGNSLYI